MKKWVVALLLILVLIVIVSPGIIGKFAERQIDDNVNRAADQSGALVVTSQGFDRGWFSSEGEHRIELNDGGMRDALVAMAGIDDKGEIPVLIINTRLDHGLIPVTSMNREKGSLAPGLGNAVSTMKIEYGDGESFDIPGTIYSDVALDGDLASQYVLESGSADIDGGTVTWQPATIELTADANAGQFAYEGSVDGIESGDGSASVSLGPMRFSGDQTVTRYGFAVGEFAAAFESIAVNAPFAASTNIRNLTMLGSAELDDDRVPGRFDLSMATMSVPNFGDVSIDVAGDFEADALSLGRYVQMARDAAGGATPEDIPAQMLSALTDLAAAGVSLNMDRLNVGLPMGDLETRLSFSTPESDPDTFVPASLLNDAVASVDIRVSEGLVQQAMAMNPQLGSVIALGYLRKDGDDYVMEAKLESGLVVINGAPLPGLPGLF